MSETPPRAALEAVLQLFVPAELRDILRAIYSDTFLHYLPVSSSSPAEFYGQTLDHLLRHGLTPVLFLRFLERRPLKRAQIVAAAGAHGIAVPADAPPSPGPTLPASVRPVTMMVRLVLDAPVTVFDEDELRATLSEILGARVSEVHINSIRPGSTIVTLDGDPETLQLLLTALNQSPMARALCASRLRLRYYGVVFGPDEGEAYLEEVKPDAAALAGVRSVATRRDRPPAAEKADTLDLRLPAELAAGDEFSPGLEAAWDYARARTQIFGADPPELVVSGRYRVMRLSKRDGLQAVFEAYDPVVDRTVALTCVSAPEHRGRARERLFRGARALGRISHPNVVRCLDVFEAQDDTYLVTERHSGSPLDAHESERTAEWPRMLGRLLVLGRTLAAVHQKGVVHRDIKPSNVVIVDGDHLLLVGFGLAIIRDEARPEPLNDEDKLAGTPAYMAPESFAGEGSTPESDQFSYCVTAWECLFGSRPFEGDPRDFLAQSVQRGVIVEPPGNTRVPRWLRRILERGLRPDPRERFPSMHVLVAEIERGLVHHRVRGLVLRMTIALLVCLLVWQLLARAMNG
ncbi:serine/threonine-protein kinase [Nannocystis punicea]|uniref:Serine/threonine-protein kinase n=1 Tax=Nannocystis punicea TaxID=2995304 RepID=A0ABY7GW76_9BACT|nr:serine/threonine-protein kinase [Nannocystis poenicansa]WAS91230.1 serine/threonine-protein kinase [Nannocystis poenicansa]